MKFRATVIFEFQAGSIVDAGHKLSDVVNHARETDDMEAKSVELLTPPGSTSVSLPSMTAVPQPGVSPRNGA